MGALVPKAKLSPAQLLRGMAAYFRERLRA